MAQARASQAALCQASSGEKLPLAEDKLKCVITVSVCISSSNEAQ